MGKRFKDYVAAAHAVQSGIAMDLQRKYIGRLSETTIDALKHLRVGIDTSKSDQAALVGILIAKGIFTLEEYVDALHINMEREVESYEKLLSDALCIKITLG